VKKFLVAVAVVGSALTGSLAAPANADSVCLPITIDGVPVCEDLTPVEQPVNDALQTVTNTVDGEVQTVTGIVDGQVQPAEDNVQQAKFCTRIVSASGSYEVYVPVTWYSDSSRYDPYGNDVVCQGYVITITPSAEVGTTTVHVPEVCLTTTDTCVGPANPSIPDQANVASTCLDGRQWLMSRSGALIYETSEQEAVSDACATVAYP